MGKKNKKSSKESDKFDKPDKLALTTDAGLSRRFKEVLVEIFRRFDLDEDGLLCDAELKGFSRVANKDDREFTEAELCEMKSMFHWKSDEPSGLTLRGFVQLYERQTAISEDETWSDLTRLGYNFLLDHEVLESNEDSALKETKETEGRREVRPVADLEEDLKLFGASSEKLLVLDSADSVQRVCLSRMAIEMGLECRMLQTEASDIPSLHVFRRPTPSGPALNLDRQALPASASRNSKACPVFTGLELDAASCKQLLDAFGSYVPAGWQVFAHHMTICLGSLSEARSSDCEISCDLQESIRNLRATESLTVEPISIGKADGVIALGVIGCPSVNRVPHITLACAKGHRPVESNKISKWRALPVDRLISLKGNVREYQQAEVSAGLTASTTQDRQEMLHRLEALEAQVLAARAICMRELLASDDASVRCAIEERERELASLNKVDEEDSKWQVAKPVKGKQGKKRPVLHHNTSSIKNMNI